MTSTNLYQWHVHFSRTTKLLIKTQRIEILKIPKLQSKCKKQLSLGFLIQPNEKSVSEQWSFGNVWYRNLFAHLQLFHQLHINLSSRIHMVIIWLPALLGLYFYCIGYRRKLYLWTFSAFTKHTRYFGCLLWITWQCSRLHSAGTHKAKRISS